MGNGLDICGLGNVTNDCVGFFRPLLFYAVQWCYEIGNLVAVIRGIKVSCRRHDCVSCDCSSNGLRLLCISSCAWWKAKECSM